MTPEKRTLWVNTLLINTSLINICRQLFKYGGTMITVMMINSNAKSLGCLVRKHEYDSHET